MKKYIAKIGKRRKWAHWHNLGSQAIQDVVERVDRAYKAYFDNKKKAHPTKKLLPKFKKREMYKSFTLKQAGYKFDGKGGVTINNRDFMTEVTNEELKRYPEELRPQLTGKLMKIDISEPSYKELLQNYAGYKNAKNDSTKMFYYNMFRQGLDILDLDDFTYQMLEMNPNSMGFWFPPLVEGLYGSAFFKVPDTKILRVPITMLQLTRLGFETLNPVTKEIVNRYCQKVFHLDGYEDYFIKTGTYSSKYEFRNAHIHNPKEINEMGEYFLFLNHLTCSMASPLNNRCFYGANTTNEWVVREYIKDKENNPTIYNGLPLHTEYRVFVDFDTKEILGASPYWRSDVMKNEFKKVSSPQERHDYVVYKMHEDILNQRYHESVQTVLAELKKVIPRIELTGQWLPGESNS